MTFTNRLDAYNKVNGSLDGVGCVNGDPSTYGRVGVGFGGTGWAVGEFS